MKKLMLVTILLVVFLSSCTPASSNYPQEGISGQNYNTHGEVIFTTTKYNSVSRIVDRDAGVVCYLFVRHSDSASIDCLPIDDTNFGEKRSD